MDAGTNSENTVTDKLGTKCGLGLQLTYDMNITIKKLLSIRLYNELSQFVEKRNTSFLSSIFQKCIERKEVNNKKHRKTS